MLAVAEKISGKEAVARYNQLADLLELPNVNRFENNAVATRRLEAMEARYADYKRRLAAEEKARRAAAEQAEVAEDHFTVAPARKKREKVFVYPPKEVISVLKPGSLRAEARDLLVGGATLAKVEELIADWDRRRSVKPFRLEPRAYGLVRLLHTYVGYALREEGVGDNKVIYLMDKEAWTEWKKSQSKA